jgi:tetratricopeptide (TPR) repeat protein
MMKRILIILVMISPSVTTNLMGQQKLKKADDYFELGENANHAGHLEEAIEYFNQCVHINPGYADAYFTRGMAKEQLKDLQGALTDYNIYLELKPDVSEVLLSRAVVRYKLGLYAQAKDDFLRLLQLPPGETTTIFYRQAPFGGGTNKIVTTQGLDKSYLLNYLGLTENKLKNFKNAKTFFDSAITINPSEPDYFVNRGIAKESLDDSTAEHDYKTALELDGSNSLAKYNLAVLTAKKGKAMEVENKLTEAIENDSTLLYSYIERGYHRLESGYLKGALDDYNAALRIDKKDPEIWLSRGIVHEKMKDFEAAYADYSKAISLDPEFDKAWLNRGNLLTKLGQYDEAIEDYTSAITFSPNYASAFYNRAIAFQRLKKKTEACADLKKAEALGMNIQDTMKSKICE